MFDHKSRAARNLIKTESKRGSKRFLCSCNSIGCHVGELRSIRFSTVNSARHSWQMPRCSRKSVASATKKCGALVFIFENYFCDRAGEELVSVVGGRRLKSSARDCHCKKSSRHCAMSATAFSAGVRLVPRSAAEFVMVR